jgi:hypothetical protein
LADLNKRKKDILTEKLKEKRKEQLKSSLAKIKEIEQKFEVAQQFKLNRCASDISSKFSSRLQQREEGDLLKHGTVV